MVNIEEFEFFSLSLVLLFFLVFSNSKKTLTPPKMSATVPGRNVKSAEEVAREGEVAAGGAVATDADAEEAEAAAEEEEEEEEEEDVLAAASSAFSAASAAASASPTAAGTSSAAYRSTALRSATSDASSLRNPA